MAEMTAEGRELEELEGEGGVLIRHVGLNLPVNIVSGSIREAIQTKLCF